MIRNSMLIPNLVLDHWFESFNFDSYDSINPSNYPYNYYIDSEKKMHVIEYALAGFDEKEIKININDLSLNIEAVKLSKIPESYQVIKNGISRKKLSISWKLHSNMDISNIDASFKNGLLKIEIPIINKKQNLIDIKIK